MTYWFWQKSFAYVTSCVQSECAAVFQQHAKCVTRTTNKQRKTYKGKHCQGTRLSNITRKDSQADEEKAC